jgi:hypothetical protein
MVTVTGLTVSRMLDIEAKSIVDGDVVGDNLILTKHNGTTINAGNVRGPAGNNGLSTFSPILYRAASVYATNLANGVTTIITGWSLTSGESSPGASAMVSYNSNGNFTINQTGLYSVTFTFSFGAHTTGRRVSMIHKNGTEQRRQNVASPNDATVEVVDHLLLTNGDILTFRAYQQSGVALGAASPFHDVTILRLS